MRKRKIIKRQPSHSRTDDLRLGGVSTQTELLGLLTQNYGLAEGELVSVELALLVFAPPGEVAVPRLELLLVSLVVLVPVLVPVWSLVPP